MCKIWRTKVKKQNKYFIAVIVSCCIVALSGCDNNSVKVGNNQKLVYGTVEKIVGNEIVLQRQYESGKEESDTTETQNLSEQSSSADTLSKESETESSSGNENEESQSSVTEEEENQKQSEANTSENTEVIVALQLPVGITIHKENKTINFTEIQEGDPLKILMEKDSSGIEVPVEAWVAELTEKEKESLENEEPTTAVSAPSTEELTSSSVPSTEESVSSSIEAETTPSSEAETSSSTSGQMTEPSFQN